MNETISIIVPVYNTEKYLHRCVDSIINQSHKNLEIILVDDGSTDSSPAICDEYAKNDKRIKVIHKKNGGLSDARNAGIDIASGDYITFVDSDDFLDKKSCENLIYVIKKDGSDISGMKYKTVDDSFVLGEPEVLTSCEIKSSKDYFKSMCNRTLDCSVCTKLFKKEIFEERRFRKGTLNEDFLFLSHLFTEKDLTISICDFCGYFYYSRSDSISREKCGKSLFDALDNAIRIKERLKDADLVRAISENILYQARTILIVMSKEQFKTMDNERKLCISMLKENKKYISGSFMSSKDKLFCRLFPLFPKASKAITDFIRK